MNKARKENEFFDFGNGAGLVPAHRHNNGGGWVADTASVDDTAYIGNKARVFGYAHVRDYAVVTGNAEVSGYAIIKDSGCLDGDVVIRGACTIKDQALVSGKAFIASNIEIGEDIVLDGDICSFKTNDCLGCPALLYENYGGSQNNKCLYCLEQWNKFKAKIIDKSLHNSNSSANNSWFPQDSEVNQNIDTKTQAPQKSGTDNP